MSRYYTLKDGEEPQGPIEWTDLEEGISKGSIGPGDYYCQEGENEWHNIDELLPPSEVKHDQELIAQIPSYVTKYSLDNEKVLLVVEQSKLASRSVVPDAVVLTDKRILIITRGLVKCKVNAAHWHEVFDTQLEEGVMSSSLTFNFGGSIHQIGGLPKQAARRFFQQAQGREKERVFIR